MQTLLLAIRSGGLADSLEAALSPYFEVHKCSAAREATALFNRLQPEVFLLDLRLVDRDGLGVLSGCKQKPAVTLAVTDFVNNDVIKWAEDNHLDGLVMLPCSVEYVTAQLVKMAEKVPSLD